MPHPIIQNDEVLRPLIDELVKASPRTAVSFAVTRRSLEEPTLRSLWEHQHSLVNLLKVLPGRKTDHDNDRNKIVSISWRLWIAVDTNFLQFSRESTDIPQK